MSERADETAGSMQIDWDVPIEMRDGSILRADVFRPSRPGNYPVLLSHGPYGKWLSFQQGFPGMWKVLEEKQPDALAGSSNRYQVWETPDPERWVPHGYVCVRVDSRGAGRSAGYIDIFSQQETLDYYDCIEWAGVQPWSSGKVGLSGVSYYAMNQWQVAALRPPHLAAICPWEGASDYYREFIRHGGILSTFYRDWYPATVNRVQHGRGERGERSTITGELVSGPVTLSDDELAANRPDHLQDLYDHRFADEYFRERTAELATIEVPLLSAANWAHHLHTRGNFEGYLSAGSTQKWLEVHGLEHWVLYYADYGVNLQRSFFDHYLLGMDNGWQDRAPVTLNLRHVDGSFTLRDESEWPLERTEWTSLYLDAAQPDTSGGALRVAAPAGASIVEVGRDSIGVTFRLPARNEPLEITGPLSATLFVSSPTAEADVFVTVRVLDSTGADVALRSALDPRGVITAGWLRASHRKLDEAKSTPYRPFHPHDAAEPLVPGEVVRLDIEIWPTSIVLPAGYSFALTVTGSDFAFEGDGPWPQLYGIPLRGQGIFLHEDPVDRPPAAASGFRLHTGGACASSVLVPIVPTAPTI